MDCGLRLEARIAQLHHVMRVGFQNTGGFVFSVDLMYTARCPFMPAAIRYPLQGYFGGFHCSLQLQVCNVSVKMRRRIDVRECVRVRPPVMPMMNAK